MISNLDQNDYKNQINMLGKIVNLGHEYKFQIKMRIKGEKRQFGTHLAVLKNHCGDLEVALAKAQIHETRKENNCLNTF